MKRGDVFVANLVPRSGSEQTGRRPVIILSRDAFNLKLSWRSIIVVPVSTSGAQARRGPTSIGLRQGDGGLKLDSVALCHQVTTLDRGKLGERLGALSLEVLMQIELGLKAALDLR